MRKHFIFFLFLFCTTVLYAQDRSAKGYVLDKDSRAAIKGVQVLVEGEKTMALTNERGEFMVEVRKGRKHLIFSKDNYTPFTYTLKPGFQRGTIRIYLESYKAVNSYAKKRLENDSLFSTYKNAISLSIIELFAVALAVRYERFLLFRHSVGVNASYYVHGMSPSNYNNMHGGVIKSIYTGFKMAPFYRFYPVRKNKMGFFLEAKIPFGYFQFKDLQYRANANLPLVEPMSLTPSFWTWGGGISLGIMTRLGKAKHGVLNISIGYQYFPMPEVPDYLTKEIVTGPSSTTVLEFYTDTDWWDERGPGARFQVVLTIGGIF